METTIPVPKSAPFFHRYARVMAVLVVIVFSIHGFVNKEALPVFSPTIILHGIATLGWFSLLVYQTGMIRAGNIPAHKRLGRLSVILAVCVLITGVLVTLSGYERSGSSVTAMANFSSILTFAILYSLALLNRRNPAAHKRFMLIGSIRMMAPAFFRISLILDVGQNLIPALAFSALAVVFVYDIRKLKRIHWATLAGGLVFFFSFVMIPTVGRMEAWRGLLDGLIN